MLKHDFGLIFWIHLLVILAYLITPFLLAWYFILVMVVIFYLQDRVLKQCVLTDAQLKGRQDIDQSEMSFYAYYFKKMKLPINPKWVKKYFAHSLVWTVFIFSLIWQLVLSKQPYWKF